MILNETYRLAHLLDDIQEMGIRHSAENPKKVDNFTVADFLLLNGLRQPPVRIGKVIHNRAGMKYVMMGYTVKHTASGIVEEIELMREEYIGEACYRTRKITPTEFYQEFGEHLEEVI